jgi:hypothetical protein
VVKRFGGIKLKKDSSNWYVVALLYESMKEGEPKNVDEGHDSSINCYEERHILIKATSEEEANLLGEKIGKEYEEPYKNQYDVTVTWKLIKILRCFELIDQKLKTGSEVYSRYILTDKELTTEDILERYFNE